ncbi:hypothetical protein OROGR_019343 [Orobanche gracilis]
MAKKQQHNTKNSEGPFKKMYDATIGRICRRHRRSQATAGTAKTPPSEPSRAPNLHYSHDPSKEVASTAGVGKNDSLNEAEKRNSLQRRDSLNDRVTDYINKMKMRLARSTTTTTVGDDNKGA